MWEKLFKLRSSPSFKAKWSSFLLESIDVPACPIFFQYIVDRLFDSLIKRHYKLNIVEEKNPEVELTYEEQNALRYTAGYVIKSLIGKLKRSAHPLKEEMVCCLLELNQTEEDTDGSEDWTKTMDRGGLTHVGNMTFGIFQSIELVVRQFLSGDPTQLQKFKMKLQEKILADDDVLHFWDLVSAGWEIEESQALLKQIVEHYVTIRGFSFASGLLEKYKQAHKKSIQKSKGVRKQLIPNTATTKQDE